FAELGLPEGMIRSLGKADITTPTTVQAAVVPDALAGRDVLGRAATGSGKTLAFGLPILARLAGSRSTPKAPRALIVVPTRELANQVRSSLEPHAHAAGLRLMAVYGGTPYDRQIKRLRAGVDVVVATPGRLKDLLTRGTCRLDRVEMVVLDEADHLCDLGFYPVVSELVGMTPSGGQRLLLSATLDGDVDKLVRAHLTDPVTHDCDPEHGQPDLAHHVLVTEPNARLASVASLVQANPRSIVFTRTRRGATRLAESLADLGVPSVDLHGSLSQRARERNLRMFSSGQADVVVATDVAARGIHVDGVSVVVHYDAPTEHKAYLHRSGRTARAGTSGAVVTMTTAREVRTVMRLQQAAGVEARHHDVVSAPQPMTAAALATSGRPSITVDASDDASRRRAGKGVGRPGGQSAGGSRPDRRAGSGRSGSPQSRQGKNRAATTDSGQGRRKPRHGKRAGSTWQAGGQVSERSYRGKGSYARAN
ncbi:MAG: DEAD/DEAH box helicase, partial [Nocardioidaceae bacterium]